MARAADAESGPESSAALATNPLARHLRFETVTLAALVIAVAACFWPLTRYFFAQDDFVLLHRAAFAPGAAITNFFGDHPGQFRPLSKGAYFVGAWRAFGLNAFPYHLVSLALHAFNTVMVWRLFLRLRAGETGALVGAALFGLSAGFFHVLAWISCIQQLSGMMFSLVALNLGFRAIDASGAASGLRAFLSLPALGSLAAWMLALGCLEQTVLLPFMFPLYAWAFAPAQGPGGAGDPGNRPADAAGAEPAAAPTGLGRVRRVRRSLLASTGHWVVLALFAAFIIFWKGIPGDGIYGFSVGANVAVNLGTYLGWSYDYWMRFPFEITTYQFTPEWTHLVAMLLVAYHLIRGRYRQVVFALGLFLVFTLPVAFLSEHQYYLHTYLPAAGPTYLVALSVRDVFDTRRLQSEDTRYTVLGVVLVALVTLSWYSVRANEAMLFREGSNWRRSFVLRRAITAHNAYVSIQDRWKKGVARQVVMVYGREGSTENARWNNRNVIESLGRGKAVQLFYGEPQPEVEFLTLDQLGAARLDRADLYFYDDHGNCFSLSEFKNRPR